MSKKRVYLTDTKLWKDICESDANVKMLLSDRGPGKSYAVKDYCMKDALNGRPFVYLRRMDIDLKAGSMTEYMADYQLMDLTSEYDSFTDFKSRLYLGNRNEDGRVSRDKFIAFGCYLSGETHYKSNAMFAAEHTKNIIYEEFVTDAIYLAKEPVHLESFYSTVKRDQTDVTLWLIGNSLSRVNPYFTHWSLSHVPRQAVGTIERYIHSYDDESGEHRTISIDVCIIPMLKGQESGWISTKKQKNTIWITRDFPHLADRKETYDVLHTVFLDAGLYRFRLELLQDHLTTFWYIEPFTKTIAPTARIVGLDYATIRGYLYGSVGFIPLNDRERTAFALLSQGQYCVCDNLTGEDFDSVWKNMKRL